MVALHGMLDLEDGGQSFGGFHIEECSTFWSMFNGKFEEGAIYGLIPNISVFFLTLALYPQQVFLCTILLIIPENVAYSSRGQPSFINEKVA